MLRIVRAKLIRHRPSLKSLSLTFSLAVPSQMSIPHLYNIISRETFRGDEMKVGPPAPVLVEAGPGGAKTIGRWQKTGHLLAIAGNLTPERMASLPHAKSLICLIYLASNGVLMRAIHLAYPHALPSSPDIREFVGSNSRLSREV